MLSGAESLTTMEALMVALSGLAMVFLVLGCLAGLILVNAKVVAAIEGRNKPAPVATPVAPVAPATPVQPAQDDQELVAVLMAAIAAETELDPGSFRITNIQAR